jgi:hypothetical protein
MGGELDSSVDGNSISCWLGLIRGRRSLFANSRARIIYDYYQLLLDLHQTHFSGSGSGHQQK